VCPARPPTRDILFDCPGGSPLRADLFLPEGSSGPHPVILWLHGGGWRVGDRTLAPDLSRFFAAQGFAMIAVDYRLSTQAVFPAQIQDVKTAIRWVRTVASSYNLNPSRIGLWGASAGGHLAALAGATAGTAFEPSAGRWSNESTEVQAVVVAYAPVDFVLMDATRDPDALSDDPESVQLPPGLRTSAPNSPESLLLGAPIEGIPERVRAANPITYLRPGLPPFLILHGLSDTTVPVDQSRVLHDALAAGGNDSTLCLIEHLGHGFLDRPHLDDGPPRPMRVHASRGGSPAGGIETSGHVFPLIERFFRRHLTQN
jgi:acetyl esterase/lipase